MAIHNRPRKPSDFQSWETGGPEQWPRNDAQESRLPQADPRTTLRPSAPEPFTAPLDQREEQMASASLPSVVPAAPRWLKSGNLTADYNSARAVGANGPELFMSSYRCLGLSCVNLNDRRANPSAELNMVEATRGVFLGVDQGGEMLVVPAFDRDFEGARNSLEGVFEYRCNLDEATTLKMPATARRSASGWVLARTGEIGRG